MNESDPNGYNPHDKGAKLDKDKNRMALVLLAFNKALQQVGLVGTKGATKYTDYGWLEVPNGIARYKDALLRHVFEAEECKIDGDSGLDHYAHVAWNALAILQLKLLNKDDKCNISQSTQKLQEQILETVEHTPSSYPVSQTRSNLALWNTGI